MIKTYLIVATLIFFVEAGMHLKKLMLSMYPRRSALITKNEDRTYFVIYLIFVVFGLLAIFMP